MIEKPRSRMEIFADEYAIQAFVCMALFTAVATLFAASLVTHLYVVEVPAIAEANARANDQLGRNPNYLYVVLFALSLFGLAVSLFGYRKEKHD